MTGTTTVTVSILSPEELKVLEDAVMETGGPYWDQILALHGAHGARSHILGQRKPYHLWAASALMYMTVADAGKPLPAWLTLVSPRKEPVSNEASLFHMWRAAKKDWTDEQDKILCDAIRQVQGPWWSRILGLYGAAGSRGNQLSGRSETDLASRARWLWARAVESSEPLNGLEFVAPKGYTSSGFPTSRGWTEEQDKLLLAELDYHKSPNYNSILSRHGSEGSESQKFSPKGYQQLRSRALKIYDFCIREGRPLPQGLQYVRR